MSDTRTLSANEQDLKRYLEAIAKVRSQCGKPPWMHYDSPEDFLLQHGEWFEPRALPSGIKRGAPKCCYANAMIVGRLLGLKYVEGYAMGVIPLEHAWCIDDRNRIYEVTWQKPGAAYLGVPFSVERADDATWNGDASVLSDPRKEFSIFWKPWTGEDWNKQWPHSDRLELIDTCKDSYIGGSDVMASA